MNDDRIFRLCVLLVLACVPSRARLIGAGRTSKPSDQSQHQTEESSEYSAPFSETIPPYATTAEILRLSTDIYNYRGLTTCQDIAHDKHVTRPLPPNSTCVLYERDDQDTQVLVVSRPPSSETEHGYVAVIYAGTDDFRNVLTDGNILLNPFGPLVNGTYPLVPPSHPNIEVHLGFNNAVFREGLFGRVSAAVRGVLDENPDYQLYTGGHSLGAADAVLTSVALSQKFRHRNILSVSFGCPKVGNRAWRDYVNSLDNVGIFRFVNAVDIVPRLPDARFVHVGHTLQMTKAGTRAYYRHFGDYSRGLAGVRPGWELAPFIIVPYNGLDHKIYRYVVFLLNVAPMDITKFYPHAFRRIDDDDDNIPQDDDFPPRDDDDDDAVGPPAYDMNDFTWQEIIW